MKWISTFAATIVFLIPAVSFSKSTSLKPRSDQEVRTIIRKKAPFWLEDAEMQVRLNKDASFSTEAAGGALTKEGKWRVEKSQLKLVWNSDNHEKVYPVAIVNRTPVISGAELENGRYVLSGP